MSQFSELYFAELEHELAGLSAEERHSIMRELQCHTEDALTDPQADENLLRMGLPDQARAFGRSLRRIHDVARREARKRRTMLTISTIMAVSVMVMSFIFPWIDGNLIAFVLGGIAVICAAVSLVGVWMPRPRLSSWLVWSGSAGLTLVGLPAAVSFSSIYLISGPLLLLTGMRLKRT